jgi:hypothetical protein
MGNYNFRKDLAAAKTCEQKVADFLEERGATEMEFNTDGRYDLKYIKDGKELTLEIKEDMMFDKTGNVAIELSSRGKQSGICKSIADNWCYVLGNEMWFCRREKLILHLIQNKYRELMGGDDKTSLLILMPLTAFRKVFTLA